MYSSLRGLWFEPRRSSLRRWMLRIHQWAGVGTGLYLAMMGFTGALSVFLPELRNTLVAPIHPAAGQPRISLQTLQSSIEERNPALRLRAVYPGQTAMQADMFEEQTADKIVREIVVDPYSAHRLIDRRKGATFYDWVRDLHANLLSGNTGKTINGFGGVTLLLTALAGIVVWWPGRRHLTASTFRVSAHKGWHRFSFDLHRLVGVVIFVPLSVAAITGVGLGFPQLAGKVASAVLGPRSELFRSKGDKSGRQDTAISQKFASLDDVLQVAREQVPGATPVRIQAPAGENGGFVVWMHLPSDWRDEGDNRVLVDGHSAKLLGVQLGRDLTRSSRVIEGATAVHYGQYGGVPTRIFAILVGLTLPLLYISGMVHWWRRVLRRPLKNAVIAAFSGTVAADDVYVVETR